MTPCMCICGHAIGKLVAENVYFQLKVFVVSLCTEQIFQMIIVPTIAAANEAFRLQLAE